MVPRESRRSVPHLDARHTDRRGSNPVRRPLFLVGGCVLPYVSTLWHMFGKKIAQKGSAVVTPRASAMTSMSFAVGFCRPLTMSPAFLLLQPTKSANFATLLNFEITAPFRVTISWILIAVPAMCFTPFVHCPLCGKTNDITIKSTCQPLCGHFFGNMLHLWHKACIISSESEVYENVWQKSGHI